MKRPSCRYHSINVATITRYLSATIEAILAFHVCKYSGVLIVRCLSQQLFLFLVSFNISALTGTNRSYTPPWSNVVINVRLPASIIFQLMHRNGHLLFLFHRCNPGPHRIPGKAAFRRLQTSETSSRSCGMPVFRLSAFSRQKPPCHV